MINDMKTLVSVVIVMMAVASVCAAEEGSDEGGLFSSGGFLSETISSAANKINRVTSGEEKIVDDNAKGMNNDALEYDGDPLGRPRGASSMDSYRNKRKKIMQEQEQKQF